MVNMIKMMKNEDQNSKSDFTFLGFDKIVELFVQNGANVQKQDALGETPLSIAAYKGYDKIANTLIRAGANVNHEVNDVQFGTDSCDFRVYSSRI